MSPRKSREVVFEEAVTVDVGPEEESPVVVHGLYAYADFEIERIGLKVKAGELFTPPAGWVRDTNQENFLMGSKQKNAGGSQVGMAFVYSGEIVNPQERNPALRERRQHTAVLPLEER